VTILTLFFTANVAERRFEWTAVISVSIEIEIHIHQIGSKTDQETDPTHAFLYDNYCNGDV